MGAGRPINAIIPPGETRNMELDPGNYDIEYLATTNNYPPSTLQDKKFKHVFKAGILYSRRLTTEQV